MERPSNRVDNLGFPVPATFDDVQADGRRRGFQLPKSWFGTAALLLLGVVGFLTLAGPATLGMLLTSIANSLYAETHVERALNVVDSAVYFSPDDPEARLLRARCLMELGRPEEALADIETAIRAHEHEELIPHMLRSQAAQMMAFVKPEQAEEYHRQAIADAKRVMGMVGRQVPTLLNNLAYRRAVANMELDAALADIDQALQLLAAERNAFGRMNRLQDLYYQVDEADFLDTRGYILYRLGRHDEALADFEKALEIVDRAEDPILAHHRRHASPSSSFAREQQNWQHRRAVMLAHRSEVLNALGRHEEARADFLQAQEHGYDPTRGVF